MHVIFLPELARICWSEVSACVCDADVFSAVSLVNSRRDTTSQPYQSWSSWRRTGRWSQTKAESRSEIRVWRASGAGSRWPRSSRTLKPRNHVKVFHEAHWIPKGFISNIYLQKRVRTFICNKRFFSGQQSTRLVKSSIRTSW